MYPRVVHGSLSLNPIWPDPENVDPTRPAVADKKSDSTWPGLTSPPYVLSNQIKILYYKNTSQQGFRKWISSLTFFSKGAKRSKLIKALTQTCKFMVKRRSKLQWCFQKIDSALHAYRNENKTHVCIHKKESAFYICFKFNIQVANRQQYMSVVWFWGNIGNYCSRPNLPKFSKIVTRPDPRVHLIRGQLRCIPKKQQNVKRVFIMSQDIINHHYSRVINLDSVTILWLVRFDDWFDFFGPFIKNLASMSLPKILGIFSRGQNQRWPPTPFWKIKFWTRAPITLYKYIFSINSITRIPNQILIWH